MRFEVTDADTAAALGSGDVPVLATPRLLAWMEAATLHAAEPLLTSGQTTVGTAVRIEHLRATAVGGTVEVTVTLAQNSTGRRLIFGVRAIDSSGQIIGQGEIDRVIVDRARFLAGVPTADGERGAVSER